MSRNDLLAKLVRLEDARHCAFENVLLSKAGNNEMQVNKLDQAEAEMKQIKAEHGITRDEVLAYRKRNTFVAKSVTHAMDHLKTIFG
jgi:hypothetical protein